MARKSVCTITVDGVDVSSKIRPLLHSLSISDKAGTASDTVNITLDDTDGQITFPRDGARIEVKLGDENNPAALTFRGVIDEVRSSGSRSSGRVITLSGKGFDTKGKPKETKRKHWDNETLGSVMKDAADIGGIGNVKIDDDLAAITRPYWAMQGESFIAFGQRVAREVGGTFKISDDTAIIVRRSGGKSATGQTLATVIAKYGDNLISWDVAPVIGRARYAKSKVRWFDKKTGTYKTEDVEVKSGGATAEHGERFTSADSGEARSQAGSSGKESERGSGGGSISIDGTAHAQPEGLVELIGARVGIDGTYRIDAVNQEYSRSSGWTTKIDLKEPQGEAGKDERKPTKKKAKKKKKDAVPTRDLGSYD